MAPRGGAGVTIGAMTEKRAAASRSGRPWADIGCETAEAGDAVPVFNLAAFRRSEGKDVAWRIVFTSHSGATKSGSPDFGKLLCKNIGITDRRIIREEK